MTVLSVGGMGGRVIEKMRNRVDGIVSSHGRFPVEASPQKNIRHSVKITDARDFRDPGVFL